MPETEITIAEVQQSLLKAIDTCAKATSRTSSSTVAEECASAALKLVEAHRILGGY